MYGVNDNNMSNVIMNTKIVSIIVKNVITFHTVNSSQPLIDRKKKVILSMIKKFNVNKMNSVISM